MSTNTAPANETAGTNEVEQLLNEVADDNPLVPVVEQLLDRVERVELSRDAAHRRIDELEERIEDEKGGVQADETAMQDDDMLPIERLIRLREEDEDHPALPSNGRESFDRATTIFENFEKWSKRTPKGRTITSGLMNLLETATGTRLAWRQVYRAMDKLEQWTRGLITHERTNRHGHVLVMHDRPSSARTGG
jgi:hypothetical protein